MAPSSPGLHSSGIFYGGVSGCNPSSSSPASVSSSLFLKTLLVGLHVGTTPFGKRSGRIFERGTHVSPQTPSFCPSYPSPPGFLFRSFVIDRTSGHLVFRRSSVMAVLEFHCKFGEIVGGGEPRVHPLHHLDQKSSISLRESFLFYPLVFSLDLRSTLSHLHFAMLAFC